MYKQIFITMCRTQMVAYSRIQFFECHFLNVHGVKWINFFSWKYPQFLFITIQCIFEQQYSYRRHHYLSTSAPNRHKHVRLIRFYNIILNAHTWEFGCHNAKTWLAQRYMFIQSQRGLKAYQCILKCQIISSISLP